MIILQNPIPFLQLSSSLSCSLKRLLLSTKLLLATLSRSWECTNSCMDLHQSANLEWNLYRTCDPWHMDQDRQCQCREAEYVYTHIRVAHLLFRNFEFSHSHEVGQVVYLLPVAPVVVEVHPCVCSSSEPADPLQCHFGNEGSRPFDFP